MFLKTTTAGKYEYVKLVESYWEGGQSKHRVLLNFGRADLLRADESFVLAIKKLCGIIQIPLGEDAQTNGAALFDCCSEATLYNYGYLAYLKLWKKLHIEGILQHLQKKNSPKVTFSIPETAFLIAAQHLLEPRSKLSTHGHQNRYFNLREIPLHHIYRMLDKLSEWKRDIESSLFEYNYARMNQKVDVVFYDVTTVAFESVKADGLRDFGFSKDCKFKEVQVVMGMVIDIDGMPVGYELFPGNTFDGKTMVKALENIKARFGINRVIIVADRGLNSKINLMLIKEAGYGYIVASKIKGMGKSIQAKILGTGGFTVVEDSKGNEEFRYKVMPHKNAVTDEGKVKHHLEEHLVITYSRKRADKDRKDRERLVEKARKLLKEPGKINASNKRGGKKYINKAGAEGQAEEQAWVLAIEKIEEDARFDGYYGIQTSEKDMAAIDVVGAYHTLWKIEESFRVMKSTMEIRPVFHWTEKRIKGHFVICFLAFLMERRLENLLKGKRDDVMASPDKIQEALNTMQLAAVTANNEELFIKVKSEPLANKIFKLLKLSLPQAVNKKQELIDGFHIEGEPEMIQLSFM